MGEIPEALCLVVQRKGVEKPGPKDPDQPMQVEIKMQDRNLYSVDRQSAQNDRYVFRVITTGFDLEGWDDHEITQ